ncbi:uncharacterized protein LOC134292137 [Aedes albopictus]|uniref:Uncharacterized protein n=1 Tax=Aedes albopictus TaxID=7160 RepID=A0ABM1Y6X4_AEDAL
MSSRCRRQYFLAEENYGNKYVKKPKRVKIGLQQNPLNVLYSEESDDHELPNNADEDGSDKQSPCSLPKPLESLASKLHPEDFDSPGKPTGEGGTMERTVRQYYDMGESESEDDISNCTSGTLNDLFSSVIANKQFKCMSDLKYSEVLFMVMNFYIRHGLTQSALEDLLKLLNVITGVKTFPETFSSFLAQVRMNPYNSYRVYFCTNCHLDYGKDEPKVNVKCPVCDSNEKDFFLVIPIEQQIREMVTQFNDKIVKYAQTIEKDKLADINRGQYAKEKLAGETRTVLTLSANTDGAAAYKSTTQKPLYPVFLTLNNLPPVDRFSKHNLIVNALWLSKGEPNTNLLFKYLCLELIHLEKTGININGSVYSIMLLQVNLDSVARCKVQNLKQFNGNYGCTYCLHPGDLKESGTSRCYPIRKQVAARQNNTTRKQMDEMCRDGNEKFGVLGKTVFASLRAFDVISSFPPDYMHAVLLGVMKQVWTMWTESEFHKQPFYIGNSLQEVEKRLLSFRPPSSFARYPRQLKEFKKYKANEWEAILLHYIYPALKGILPQVYLDHIMLLSSSIFKLLSPKLNESTINGCDKQLKQFETKFQTLYGRESMTYNVHLVRHLIQAVRNFGALYNFSLFPYESGSYKI